MRQQGAALLVTVWVITLGMVVAGIALLSSRGDATRARQLVQRIQAKHAADSGIDLGILEILGGRKALLGPMRYTFTVGEFTVVVDITDETGKIDLNHADERLLAAYFKAAGLAEQQAQNLAAQITDRRADFKGTSPVFESVGDVRSMAGIDVSTFACISSQLTVLAARKIPDIRHGGAAVVAAVRTVFPDIDVAESEGSTLGQQTPEGRLYSVRALAANGQGPVLAREAVLRLTGELGAPYLVHSWRSAAYVHGFCKAP